VEGGQSGFPPPKANHPPPPRAEVGGRGVTWLRVRVCCVVLCYVSCVCCVSCVLCVLCAFFCVVFVVCVVCFGLLLCVYIMCVSRVCCA